MGNIESLGVALMVKKLDDVVARFSNLLTILAVAAALAILATALDRRPPFKVIPHHPSIIKAGSYTTLDVPVWRDMSRDCDAQYSRYLFDASNARVNIDANAYASADTIRKMEANSPGRLIIKFPVPPLRSVKDDGGVITGLGSVDVDLLYYCTKGHYLWPIAVNLSIPVLIVP